MTTVTSRTFQIGRGVAVRIPKEVAYGSNIEVIIEREGDVLTVRPAMDRGAGGQPDD